MKRGLCVVFVLGVLFFFTPAGAGYGGQGVQPQGPGPAGPGEWVNVPGESVNGQWVPPHRLWVPAYARPMIPRGAYPTYVPPPPYVVAPPPPPPAFISILADLFVMRPLGIAGLAIGTGASIVAMPFSIPSGSVGVVNQELIVRPFDFTFRRPLGVW